MIEYVKLGATLFVPSTHKNLQQILTQEKYPNLKSIVIDAEDGISEDDLLYAKQIIKDTLKNYQKNSLSVFIRPNDPNTLKEFLSYKNIDKVDGFILPKFSLDNADQYLDLLKNTKHNFMPSIEGKELFETDDLKVLRKKITEYKDRVILIRFGLEDMLRQLGMKRTCEYSIFDYAVCSSVIGNFLCVFKSKGFAVSGGVYPCFKDKDGFIKDLKRDLKEGLFTKTVIHPSQIDLVHEIYKVTKEEYKDAKSLLEASDAVINLGGAMGEVKTMSPYAKEIIQRADVYGVL
ncbi:HpcH/HpaI aldolase/citrate lyase family protein [Sulfurimonas sp.]|uniref:HpcH/HpaI aldolase/citrate lyase family protein n=1 Tax=Sulfurimonas sp. TaxID=2022749 RepID=UPI0035642D37